jgi:hypothetical protein
MWCLIELGCHAGQLRRECLDLDEVVVARRCVGGLDERASETVDVSDQLPAASVESRLIPMFVGEVRRASFGRIASS